ncbi:Nn.00g072090.m01.CDS01 [Neocucurbitaria sp. VM-36]
MADSSSAMVIPPYSNKAPTYLIPVCILGVIALVLVIARIYTRVTRTKRLYLDDWLIVIAEPLSLVGILIAITTSAHGWGKPAAYFTPTSLKSVLKLQFALQTVWLFTLCLVRLSVACSLLRFGTDRRWRWTLYFIMGLQVLISSSYVVIQFGQCKPVSSNWESVPDAKCWDFEPIINYGWAVAAIYVTMDLVLSLMPIRLIRTLHRSTSEKILICFLMSLGLFATAVACAKMTTFTNFGKGDPMQATIMPSLWAKLEEEVGIIATSLPWLKRPAENLLKKMGLLKEHQLTRPSFVGEVGSSRPSMTELEERSSGDDSSNGKGNMRVDSVAVALGNTKSNASSEGSKDKAWQPV